MSRRAPPFVVVKDTQILAPVTITPADPTKPIRIENVKIEPAEMTGISMTTASQAH